MKYVIRKLIKFFFNTYYRIKPPEMAKYWRTKESAPAKLTEGEDGSLQMHIQGEKYPLYAFPRGHVLMGPLAKLKQKVKDMVFNQAFKEIGEMYKDVKYDVFPIEKCAPAIREMARVFDKMEHMEIQEDMKARMRLLKKVVLWFLQEDDAYRFRAQYFLSEINQNKVKLSKADKYWARAKYWKCDYDRFDY